jgi:hypothetical protein
MKKLLAICIVLGCATAQAQDAKYPTYRSPNQKQADYQRAQAARTYRPPTATVIWSPYYNCYDPYRL